MTTDQNPNPDQTPPDAPAPDEAPVEGRAATPTVKPDDLTGHMVYDLTLRRFVGRKADTRAKAEKTVARVKGHRYEVRAV